MTHISPLQSKKFVAYLINSILWKGLLGIMMFTDAGTTAIDTIGGNAVRIAAMLIIGFLDTAYLVGQAGIDRYVRVAEIAAGVGQSPKELLSEKKPVEGGANVA